MSSYLHTVAYVIVGSVDHLRCQEYITHQVQVKYCIRLFDRKIFENIIVILVSVLD